MVVVREEISSEVRRICTKEANKFSNVNEKIHEFA
jgi:hypothetical protein